MSSSMPEESRRKRVRKGTKSCWECKRRKIKCVPSQDNAICASCLDRSTPCLSQEYVNDPAPHHADYSALAERMARVESLLEALMDRMTPSSITARTDSQPLVASPSNASGLQAEVAPLSSKLEILRLQLAAMLPCQADVDCLFASSHGCWLIQQHMMPDSPDSVDHQLFNVSEVSKQHPITITRLLLCIAICIQQLPFDMNLPTLQTTAPLRDVMSDIIDFIVQNVTSIDELTGSTESVECLALQGMYEVNAGNLRRSWRTFRRAITIAQLLGLHRVAVTPSQERQNSIKTKQHHLWYQIARGERYLSTLLGLPSSTGSAVFPCDDDASWLSLEDRYHKHLYHISGLILARNQGDGTHSFSTTQQISEKLDALAEQMPPSWWEIPTKIPTNRTKEASAQFERIMCQIWHFELATLVHLPFMFRAATDRRYEYSHISCLDASRNLIQRWIFIRESHNMLLFSNLLEFQAFTAATTLLLGLLAAPKSTNQGILQERCEDSQLIETVVANFERRKQHGIGMSVGTQSISVIRTLQQFLHGRNSSDRLCVEIPFFGVIKIVRGAVQPLEGERLLGANVCQSASFLGPAQSTAFSSMRTERISTSMTYPRNQTPRKTDENEDNAFNNSMGIENTIFHFSGGHFQLPGALSPIPEGLDPSEWTFNESDMIFFDSLINTDLIGNWTL
ncbi:hypothetical protein BO94DRAFT_590693 [Aspergillus sclerotioniger CBS 115572]|uniref:Zn(2)-C6 fungal-type domain-containing protein n=1 Tax=Aspergillus sclerotioniger CBS 115572 TaxID=1450535 RepID=A0A317V6W1_9EURO|nr:hypothetical protein BO94DRAFT_590693 [Aspergillus sclerotioniger CBS 115572]PWY68572.1 hypothetical protein BO94DRAFT_590693 [Aspergillus sclerotioniger CBS 115572]